MNLSMPEGNFKQKLVKEVKGLAWAFFIVMFVRTFLYQPFNIPSGSMIPTLLIGDFLLVSKFQYGYSNQTFPLRVPLLNGRMGARDLKQGEVAVFNNPRHAEPTTFDHLLNKIGFPIVGLDYIKRVIGLPGDEIQVIKGVLHINGKPVHLEEVGTYKMTTQQGQLRVLTKYIETLPNGVKHPILKDPEVGDEAPHNNTPKYKVPAGHYFMMGDNRDHSMDSRWEKEVGFIPFENFLGRAEVIFFSTDAKWWEPWRWVFGARLERTFNLIR